MRTLTKTIEKQDYDELLPTIRVLRKAATELSAADCFIDGLTEARLWEYSLALTALLRYDHGKPQELRIVDVGAGDGLLGPALSLVAGYNIDEIEPRASCGSNRIKINQFLASKNKPQINWWNGPLRNGKQWDMVFSISVAEHIPAQDVFWQLLVDSVAGGGLLFLTVDVVPDPNRSYVFDNLRAVNYTMDSLKNLAEWVLKQGFKWFGGDPDWVFHGPEFQDYSFCSMCFVKEN